MKNIKILTIILVVLLLVTFLCSGCGVVLVPKYGEAGTGEKETRQYNINDFTNIYISSTFIYEIKQADDYSISITASESMFDDIRLEKNGETLTIDTDFLGLHWALFTVSSRPRAVITMPELKKLDSHGATRGIVIDFNSTENMSVVVSGASEVEFRNIDVTDFSIGVSGASDVKIDAIAEDIFLNVSGASELNGDITVENLFVGASGSSDIHLDGTAGDMTVYSSGASNMELKKLKVNNANIALNGSSDCDIYVSGRLDANIRGASSLGYLGDPELGETDVDISSELERIAGD